MTRVDGWWFRLTAHARSSPAHAVAFPAYAFACPVLAENASLPILVMQLGAEHARPSPAPHVDLRCREHAEGRGNEVDPERGPVAGPEAGADGARGIHAH